VANSYVAAENIIPQTLKNVRALILGVFLEVKQWMLLFSMSHRKSGQITKEFVTAFCESFNKFFPNYGSDQIEFSTAEFLNPFTKGSRLRLNKFQSTLEHICNVLQSTADQQEEESQSNIDVGGPSQVLK